jgi:hypothetical protein
VPVIPDTDGSFPSKGDVLRNLTASSLGIARGYFELSEPGCAIEFAFDVTDFDRDNDDFDGSIVGCGSCIELCWFPILKTKFIYKMQD